MTAHPTGSGAGPPPGFFLRPHEGRNYQEVAHSIARRIAAELAAIPALAGRLPAREELCFEEDREGRARALFCYQRGAIPLLLPGDDGPKGAYARAQATASDGYVSAVVAFEDAAADWPPVARMGSPWRIGELRIHLEVTGGPAGIRRRIEVHLAEEGATREVHAPPR